MSASAQTAEGFDAAAYTRYTEVARATSRTVIERYSTSFSLASRLLPESMRAGIYDIYALVRVADEIVDGSAAGAGLAVADQRQRLDAYEAETLAALERGFSTDLVVHAFAVTARRVGISAAEIVPFFASMRRDLDSRAFEPGEVETYIYGSAEVVGLMCLHVFLDGDLAPSARRERLIEGARHLGAAFQKINFLRDAAADLGGLGRNYFYEVDLANMTLAERDIIIADIENDVRIARSTIELLPRKARAAVLAATGLFAALTRKAQRTDPAELMTRRIRVPGLHKLAIAFASAVRGPLGPDLGSAV